LARLLLALLEHELLGVECDDVDLCLRHQGSDGLELDALLRRLLFERALAFFGGFGFRE
jgi:hypothetical protein